MTAPLPRYVQERQLADGTSAYYWVVPKRTRPDIQIRTLALGIDREAACAVAERILRDADAKHVSRGREALQAKTELAREFASLDRLSRERALTESESQRLEQVMIDLRMIEI